MTDRPPICIVHVDPNFVVVDKPSGLLSVPGRRPDNKDSVAERVKASFIGCIEQPAVHRLDMATSGLLVVARNAETHRHLSIQFQNRETEKRYVALLDGHLAADAGEVRLRTCVDWERRPIQIVDEQNGKLGFTRWHTLAVEGDVTRVQFEPITGRTHQLRIHAASEHGLGVPIVGDMLYGRGERPSDLKLHAAELGFRHPATGELLTFRSPPRF